MALLIDESTPNVSELLNVDGSLMDVAGAEGIDLQGKIAMARAEILTKLQIFLMDQGEGPDAAESIVVTEPLKRWITLSAIGLSYRDGHFRHLSDRYKEKWQLYETLAEVAREDLMRMGVGRVSRAIRRPTMGATGSIPGSLAEGSYVLAASAVGVDGAESESSEIASVYVNSPSGIRLDPPALADSTLRWNLYAGRTADQLQKQNSIPLPSYEYFALTELQNLGRPGCGQQPTAFTKEVRCIRRG
ncbi:MAG: hypothetical protein JST93_31125 [Acidobacteria bacterium]|nr:hypothetical protein [Acidobacteriota bacterium]